MEEQISKNCPKCNNNEWWAIDSKEEYTEVCSKCYNMIAYRKSSFVDSFLCEKCGNNSGTLIDDDESIAIKCDKCNTKKIVKNKLKNIIDNRNSVGIIVNKKMEDEAIRCPKCNSTQITTGTKGFSLITGFIGSNKTMNRCARCGYAWKPQL